MQLRLFCLWIALFAFTLEVAEPTTNFVRAAVWDSIALDASGADGSADATAFGSVAGVENGSLPSICKAGPRHLQERKIVVAHAATPILASGSEIEKRFRRIQFREIIPFYFARKFSLERPPRSRRFV